MIGFIYITTNKITGERYLGKRVYKPGWERYLGSSKELKEDIKKLGRNNFIREIIEECQTHNDLTKREIFYQIKYDVIHDPMWYNRCINNEKFNTYGLDYTPEHREKIGIKKRGKTYEEMYGLEKAKKLKKMISEQWKNKPKTERQKKLIGNAQIGLRKGKTWEDIFGKENAKKMKILKSISSRKRNKPLRLWNIKEQKWEDVFHPQTKYNLKTGKQLIMGGYSLKEIKLNQVFKFKNGFMMR